MAATPYRYVPLVSDTLRVVRRRVNVVRFSGNEVECPVCDRSFKSWTGPNDVCPYCGSRSRHRLAKSIIEGLTDTLPPRPSTLLFAPDWGFESWLKERMAGPVTTCDYSAPNVDRHEDITAMKLEDAAVDLVICSHVLEHVPDDAAAFRELFRILRPGGVALLQVPFDQKAAETYEDWSITAPSARAQAFGQFDHVRLYGRDIVKRIDAAGFSVETVFPARDVPKHLWERYGIWDDVAFICRKPNTKSVSQG